MIGQVMVDGTVLERPDDIVKVRDGVIVEQRPFTARQGDWAIDYISPTQLNQFQECPRKWFFRYVCGHKYPQTDAMLKGTLVHMDLEQYMRGEKPVPELPEPRYLYDKGLLPPREQVFEVECSLEEEDLRLCDPVNGPVLKGFIDLTWVKPVVNTLQIWDWKLRSGFGYAPSPAKLAEDFQAVLYSWGIFYRLERRGFFPTELPFAHMNLLRKDKGGPTHKLVETVMQRKDVERDVQTRIEPLVRQINEAAKKNARLVKPVKKVCFKYGKACEHMAHCKQIPHSNAPSTPVTAARVLAYSAKDLLLPQTKPTDGGKTMTTLLDMLTPQHAQQAQAPNGAAAPQQPVPQPQYTQPMPQAQPLAQPQAPQQYAQPQYSMPMPQQPMPQQQAPQQYAQPMPMPQAQQPMPQAQQPMPQVQQPMPQVQQPMPQPVANNVVAPNIQPPDTQPDRQPTTAETVSVADFKWDSIDGIGKKGSEKIIAHLHENGITSMAQLLDGFDFKDLPGVGAEKAQEIRIAIDKLKPYQPESAQPAAPPTNGLPGKGQADKHSIDHADQEAIMKRAGAVVLNGGVPDLSGLSDANREHFASWRASAGYAPPPQQPAAVVQQPAAAPQPAEAAKPSPAQLVEQAKQMFDQTGQRPPVEQWGLVAASIRQVDEHIEARRAQWAAQQQAQQAPAQNLQHHALHQETIGLSHTVANTAPAPIPSADILAKIKRVEVERYVSIEPYNNGAVRFHVDLDEGDDRDEVVKALRAYAEYIAFGEY